MKHISTIATESDARSLFLFADNPQRVFTFCVLFAIISYLNKLRELCEGIYEHQAVYSQN